MNEKSRVRRGENVGKRATGVPGLGEKGKKDGGFTGVTKKGGGGNNVLAKQTKKTIRRNKSYAKVRPAKEKWKQRKGVLGAHAERHAKPMTGAGPRGAAPPERGVHKKKKGETRAYG